MIRQKYHKGKLLCVEQTSIHKEQNTCEKNVHWIPLKIIFIKPRSKNYKNFSGAFQTEVQYIFDSPSFPIEHTPYPFTVIWLHYPSVTLLQLPKYLRRALTEHTVKDPYIFHKAFRIFNNRFHVEEGLFIKGNLSFCKLLYRQRHNRDTGWRRLTTPTTVTATSQPVETTKQLNQKKIIM